MNDKLNEVVKSVNRLAATDPASGSSALERARELVANVNQLKASVAQDAAPAAAPPRDVAPANSEFVVENPSVISEIDRMRSAAVKPAEKYGRIILILDGLRHAAVMSERPQNIAVRPRIAEIVKKIAGVFADVDSVQDMDKPLEQIERAVHSLYGNQSANSTYFFGRRGKGGHGAPAAE
jgi:hypothetical protein